MSQFFYNIVTTTWGIKHVLCEIYYKVITTHGEGKQTILLPGLMHATSKLSKLSDRPRTIHLVFLFFNIENEGFASSVKENIGK